jgi:hypothetical protein
MPLTTTFIADFSSFYDAVNKATAKLGEFQKEADQVAGTLNKFADAFSGRKLIEQATLMVKAVSEIEGGVKSLTDKELKRLGAVVDEASAKMQKMGVVVPQSFKDISKAAADVNPPTESWGANLLNLTNIVRGFMALQIVQWFKDAAAAGLEWAGSMTKMHAQTDLTYHDLQILENVAIETSVSMETLAKGVQILQQRIGDGKARQGITDLGLSFDAIAKMKPADQLAAVAAAIAKIPDPTQRAAAAYEIWGGTSREMLPALRANLEAIARTTKFVKDEHIEAADRMSVRWTRFWKEQDKGWGEWVGMMARGAEQGLSTWERASQRAAAIRRGGAQALVDLDRRAAAAAAAPPTLFAGSRYPTRAAPPPNVVGGSGAVQALTRATREFTAAQAKAVAETRRAAEAQAQWEANTRKVGAVVLTTIPHLESWRDAQRDIYAFNEDLSDALMASQIRTDAFGHSLAVNLVPSLQGLGTTIQPAAEQVIGFGETITDYFAKGFGQDIVRALAGGGNVVKTALAGFGSALFAPSGAFATSITSGVNRLFGKDGMMGKIGTSLASMVPMIGSFIGPAIEGVTALFKKLFGKSEESAKVSPLRDEFFKLQGGLETLNPRVQQLAGNLSLVQAVFDAKTVEQYNAAIANLNSLFQQETDALALLTATAEKYGLTIEELGPAMQRQELDKQAQQLYKDWQVLNAAGIDTTVITKRMADAINKYIGDASKMGTEVPAAMRPMLEQMVSMGQLTDASGNKIENLEDAGISFALTMSEGFQALIGEVKKLTDLIARSLGNAIEDTTRKIEDIPTKIPVEIRYKETGDVPRHGGGEIPGYQMGTGGKFVDFGAGTLAMLHGKEAIVPEGAVQHAIGGGAGAAATPINVVINAQGSFFDTPGDLQRLAEKVNDALTAKHGFTNRLRAA